MKQVFVDIYYVYFNDERCDELMHILLLSTYIIAHIRTQDHPF